MTQQKTLPAKFPAWTIHHPKFSIDMLGFIPFFLNEANPASAREQLDHNYSHGGGWNPFPGFELLPNQNLQYPGDPETRLLAATKFHSEEIRFYEHSWVMIIQPDGKWEVSRMD